MSDQGKMPESGNKKSNRYKNDKNDSKRCQFVCCRVVGLDEVQVGSMIMTVQDIAPPSKLLLLLLFLRFEHHR